jgi:hypothetical protein
MIADLAFFWIVRTGSNRQLVPLAAGMESIQNVVEDLEKRDFADQAAFGGAQAGADVVVKVLLGYLGGYGAHHCAPSWWLGNSDDAPPPSQASKVSISSDVTVNGCNCKWM